MVIATIALACATCFSGWRAVINSDHRRDVAVLMYLVAFWICLVLTGVLLLAQVGVENA